MADLGGTYVRWVWCRAVLHRGWWLVTSVYLVVDARLPASQLVLLGVGQAVVALVFEVPAGVLADHVSRKWSLVVSQVLMGGAMLATGLVDGFLPLLATQLVWGLAWTFASGADVAWVSDELGDPAYARTVLIRAEQAQLLGTVAGLPGVGGLAWLVGRGPAMVLAGAVMVLLGLYVIAGFPERRFVPAPSAQQWPILKGVLRNRTLLAAFGATFLVQGAADAFGRLYPLQLLALGPGVDPVVWLTGLGVLMCLGGAAALRLAQARISGQARPTQASIGGDDTMPPAPIGGESTTAAASSGGEGAVRNGYVFACAIAVAGVAGLALAPGAAGGSLAVLLAAGALPLTRSFGTIWVNNETVGAVRATVHSLLAQSEYAGKIACGLTIALFAERAALAACAVLILAGALIARLGHRRRRSGPEDTGSSSRPPS